MRGIAGPPEFFRKGRAMATTIRKHWYPRAKAERQPTPWWYFGRAVYVSRRDYGKIFLAFLAVGLPPGIGGLALGMPWLFRAAVALAAVGLALLGYSLIGLYRMYGPPSSGYLRRLLELGGVSGPAIVADLHIGTYRHAYALADLLPGSKIHSVDCWGDEDHPGELAIQDVRDLEPPPAGDPRIVPAKLADDGAVPLPDASCDAVVFGFGTHEIPTGGPREALFQEAARILKPGGRALLFEHGIDLHNALIFGPVIHHVTKRREWRALLGERFEDIRTARTSHAVDLFAGTRWA